MAFNPPLGSTNADVFMGNVQRLDELVNGPAADVPDRAGDPLYSWRGIHQNLIPLSRQYMTLADAQADIANIPEGSTTYYRSPDDSALAIEVINNGGTLTETGRKMPSQGTMDSALDAVNKRFTSSDTANDAINFKDKMGRRAVSLLEDGTVQANTLDAENLLTSVSDDGWLVKIAVDKYGNVCNGVDAQGRTHITELVNYSEPANQTEAVNVLAKFTVSPNQFEGTSQHDRIEAALTFLERRGGEGYVINKSR